MELLQEFVSARVNMSDAEREARERELLRRRRERAVVAGWFEAVRARRTVRAARPAAGQAVGESAAEAAAGESAAVAEPQAAAEQAPARDLANVAQ